MTSEYPPVTFGSGGHAYELIKVLSKSNTIHVLTPKTPYTPKVDEDENIIIHRVPCMRSPGLLPISFSFISNVLARKIIKEHDIDIIQGHQWDSVIFPFPKNIGFVFRSNITAIGVSEIMKPLANGFQRVMYSVATFLDKLVCRRADRIIAVSDFIATELKKYGIENKVDVIRNGVNTHKFSPKVSGNEIRRKYGLEGSRVLLFSGRLVPSKGIEFLLKALPIVIREHPNVKLMIAGGTTYSIKNSLYSEYNAMLRKIVDSNDLNDFVISQGHVNFSRMPAYYAAADICVMPSVYEPLGNVSLEVLASGRPLIASRTGGIPEVVENRKNGILVPPKNPRALADALLELLDDEDLRKKIGRNARKKAETMSWDKVGRWVLRVLKAVKEARCGG